MVPTYSRQFIQATLFEPHEPERYYYFYTHIFGWRKSGSKGFCAPEYLVCEQWCQDWTLVGPSLLPLSWYMSSTQPKMSIYICFSWVNVNICQGFITRKLIIKHIHSSYLASCRQELYLTLLQAKLLLLPLNFLKVQAPTFLYEWGELKEWLGTGHRTSPAKAHTKLQALFGICKFIL